MAEQDTLQERTEQPTPKRLRDAQERGQVPRSRDLSGMAVMMAGAAGLLTMAPDLIDALLAIFRRLWVLPRAGIPAEGVLLGAFAGAVLDALLALAPLLVVLAIAALGAPLLLGGWVFNAGQMAFKGSKLNPLQGLKRMFSVRALVELGKALAKFLVVALAAALLLGVLWDPLLQLRSSSLLVGLHDAGWMMGWSFLVLSCALIAIAAVDVPFQIWQHSKQLRMTRQEVRDELKETEGKPEVRSRIRQVQQQLAQARMMAEVPKADVVITNPTHVSVALRYDERRMRAPVVVAKGVDLIALRIRQVAAEHAIATVRAPLLARALNASTELRQPIPAPLYLAVAQILAFVYQLRTARRRGTRAPPPPEPRVPDDFVEALRKRHKNV